MDMKTAILIDYAKPLINIDEFTKQIHDSCLKGDYLKARDQAILLSAEAKVLQHVLTLMEERKFK